MQLSLQQSMLLAQGSPADAHTGPAAQTRGPLTTFGQDRRQQAPAELHCAPTVRQPVVGGSIGGGPSVGGGASIGGGASVGGASVGGRASVGGGPSTTFASTAASTEASTEASTAASRGDSTLIDSLLHAAASTAAKADGRRPRTHDIVMAFTRLETQR